MEEPEAKGTKGGPRNENTSGPTAASADSGGPSAETKPMQEDTENQAKKRKRDPWM